MPLIAKIPGKHYFISIFVIGTALFTTFGIVIYRHYDNSQKFNSYALHDYEVLRQSRLILFNILNMETGVRGYLLTGRQNFLEPYYSSLTSLPKDIASLRNMTANNEEQQKEIDEWLKKIETFETTLVSQLKAYNSSGITAFSPRVLQQQKGQMDGLRSLLETYITARSNKLNVQLNDVRREQDNFFYILVIGTILAIGAMLVATVIILTLIGRAQRSGMQLAQAEDRFKLVMNGINDGVFDFHPQSETIYYSPVFKSMLGYSESEFPNTLRSFKNILHPDDAEATWETIRRYEYCETDNYSNTFRLQHKNGDWRWILARGVGFWDKYGEMTRLIGTHVDITEHKKREEDLSQANSDLETFTYIASHDLRSPLVNLKGFANELMLAVDRMKPVIHAVKSTLSENDQKILSECLEEDIPEALKFIEKSTDRMDTLTTAVLDLSRIGKREYHSEPVAVQAIVKKCLNAQTYELGQKEVDVTCNYLPDVISDALALEQIFSNLLDNAVKYLDPSRKGKITISAKETAADVIFSIEDNGRGIADTDRAKVFEIFRRARNTEDVRGSGMGMSFVKAMLRRIGGTIWFESVVGVGTIFYFRLPKQFMKGKTV